MQTPILASYPLQKIHAQESLLLNYNVFLDVTPPNNSVTIQWVCGDVNEDNLVGNSNFVVSNQPHFVDMNNNRILDASNNVAIFSQTVINYYGSSPNAFNAQQYFNYSNNTNHLITMYLEPVETETVYQFASNTSSLLKSSSEIRLDLELTYYSFPVLNTVLQTQRINKVMHRIPFLIKG